MRINRFPVSLAGRLQPAALHRALMTGVLGLACLLAIVPAAHAHEEDAPPSPEKVLWGLVLFAGTLIWMTVMCYHAARPHRARRSSRRYEPALPTWLRRRLPRAAPADRKRPRRRRWMGPMMLTLLLGLSALAYAHPMAPDLTVAQLRIHYHLLDMTLRGPAGELVSPAGVAPSDFDGEGTKKAVLDKLSTWLPQQFDLQQDGKPLKPEVVSADYQNYSSGPEYTLSVHYVTARPAERLRVTSKFVHTIVSARGFQIELKGDKETTRVFDTGANLANIWNNVVDFVQMGMEHLFTGPDHILFICTLVFALMDFRSVVKMLTGFTIGHSITLILSTFNVIHLSPRLADMGIALTIIYVGLDNILHKGTPKNRFWLVFCFGLIHGMGFSQALREVGLPQQGLVLCLLGFNVGVEIAQIIIVACVYPVLSRVRWYKEALYEEKGTRQFKGLMNYGSALTACMGLYWLVERIVTP